MENDSGPFESGLPEGWQRFLSHVIEHAFSVGRRTPEDFIRHFPPAAIMDGLGDEPERRASILVACTGVKNKIAIKKTTESCAGDLQIALDEAETDAESIIRLFAPDDRVLYLEAKDLWGYLTEGEFWVGESSSSAKEHVAFILERALQDELIAPRDIVHGITTEKLVELLPREELGVILSATLLASHDGQPFTEADLIEMVPPVTLVESIPLADIWNDIVIAKIAARNGLVEGADASVVEADAAATNAPVLAAKDEDENEADEDEDEDDEDMDMDIDDALDMDASGDDEAINPPV